MTLELADCTAGVQYYWRVISQRSVEVQRREREFPDLAKRFALRQPPHFTRQDLHAIIEWKYTDKRRCNRALAGLITVSDEQLQSATSRLVGLEHPSEAAHALHGLIKGVGIAGVSAILAAALPQRFPVIDIFALLAISHHEAPSWLQALPRNASGRFEPNYPCYVPYTQFCRGMAASLSQAAGEPWSPRKVDMALWGIGKQLEDEGRTRTEV